MLLPSLSSKQELEGYQEMVLVSACLSKNKTEINEREWREKEKQKQSYYMILGKKDLELKQYEKQDCYVMVKLY